LRLDAIRFITGCTFGIYNLIHLDYGKNAFRFIRRLDNKAIRIRVKHDASKPVNPEEELLLKHWREGTANGIEKQEAEHLQRERTDFILNAPLDDLLEVKLTQPAIPARARIFNSLDCAGCGEKPMETRMHLLEGKAFCLECFEKLMK
jgi:formylmethanofuran dehydrogenase subunit E